MHLIVVGAGIAGSCVTRMAREDGHKVTVIAMDNAPGSRSATAVLRRSYHTGKPEELAAWDYALGVYERWGIGMRRGGAVSSYRRPLAGERDDADWLLLDPAEPLVEAEVKREVMSAWGERVWYGPGDGLAGDAVVAAWGTAGGPGTVTWGVTWAHTADALRQPEVLRVYQYAPYRTLIGGVTGGRARVGSSSAGSREKAVEQGEKMLQTAWDLGWLHTRDGWEMQLGARLKRDSGTQWWREEDGHWEIGGFHRTGYALAPLAARQLLDQIEQAA